MISFRRPAVLWFVLTALVALSLWGIAARAYPPYPDNRFSLEHSYSARWPDLPPFTLPGVDYPAFYDLQVLIWGVDVAAKGRDPYTEPPPAGAPYTYNYPRIWTLFAVFGFTLEHTRPLGLALLAAFLGCVLAVTRPRSGLEFFWVLALLLSPPTLKAITYANNDLIIFVLLSLTALVWTTRRPIGGWPALGLLGFAAMLKLYPACALLAFIDGRRRALIASCAAGVVLAAFFAYNAAELRSVSSQTPRPHARAIGSQVLSSRLLDGATRDPDTYARLEAAGGMALWHRFLPLATSTALVGLLGVCVWFGQRHARAPAPYTSALPSAPATGLAEFSFRLGACTHLAVFAIGHNYMHREILLIFVGPYLLADARRRWLAFLILPIVWFAGVPTGPIFLAVQLATWVLTGGLAYWLARSLAPDLRRTWHQRNISVDSPASPSHG
jgi:hypothetical protein